MIAIPVSDAVDMSVKYMVIYYHITLTVKYRGGALFAEIARRLQSNQITADVAKDIVENAKISGLYQQRLALMQAEHTRNQGNYAQFKGAL